MTEEHPSEKLTAIVLAGDRQTSDCLREHSGTPSKALIKIQGTPMIHRVLAALRNSPLIEKSWISGPPESVVVTDQTLKASIEMREISWRSPESSPSNSAHKLMSELNGKNKFLLTTADHPLLSTEIVDLFCQESLASGADVTVGLAPYELVKQNFPDMKKTVLRFRDAEYCGCNLFAFLSPEGREAANFWRKIENERKKPLLLIKLLGWWSVIRYRFGWLTLEDALARLSKILGLRLKAIILPYANAAVDVDSIADFQIVENALSDSEEPSDQLIYR